MRQLSLFTPGGKPYSDEAERAELRVMILDHLAEVFHVWDGAGRKPVPLRGDCPNCKTAQMTLLVNPLSLFAVAYCRECGWAKDFDLTK
ncbi:MAG TPA: hypothetical protein GX506_00320 [Firmicutes bacterium]|nr:hypothetical protein [Bacillota bacterium]